MKHQELSSFEALCKGIRIRRIINPFLKSRKKAFENAIKTHANQANEEIANKLWVLKTIFEVQNKYLSAFSLMKKGKYYKAWCALEYCEISLYYLYKHYTPDKNDEYLIKFIGEKIEQWQSLFPYKVFLSPEILEKKLNCNICNSVITPLSYCQHKVGHLYLGKLCLREIGDFEFLGLSLVENPVQKYSVPFTKDEITGKEVDHYDYSSVKYVADRLDSSFENWKPNWVKKMIKRSEFNNVLKESLCPCNSKKLFIECCYNKKLLLLPHLQVEFHKELPKHLSTGLLLTG